MISRIFHPVGQGAYYTEEHDNYIVVYDCGSFTPRDEPSDRIKSVVTSSFENQTKPVILFISHFDCDHVNLIPTLIKSCGPIKAVIMPLLYDFEKSLIEAGVLSSNTAQNDLLTTMLEKPNDIFKETKIIKVKPHNPDEQDTQDNRDQVISIDKISGDISSGTKISIGNPEWIYIPYNFDYPTRYDSLTKELLKPEHNIDVSKLNDSAYVAGKRKELKKVYASIEGNINENSLIVYSGPSETEHNYILDRSYSKTHCCCDYYRPCSCNRHHPACLFTGDYDLHNIIHKKHFLNLWENIGTIQIPHHGSLNSFDSTYIFDENARCFPITFGTTNSFGHPSSVVLDKILKKHSCPIQITEDKSTTFIQIID